MCVAAVTFDRKPDANAFGPHPSESPVVQRRSTDTCLPFSCELYNDATGEGAYVVELPTKQLPRSLPRYYKPVGTFSCETAPSQGALEE
jgi:hypothetical protein